mmetsp:Transcript_115642/g.332117  ORF Transcript_115642/g.332117 Transcript_115642/m.332117 type:complete len:398 (+) Transcript_115642:311-1504(+)
MRRRMVMRIVALVVEGVVALAVQHGRARRVAHMRHALVQHRGDRRTANKRHALVQQGRRWRHGDRRGGRLFDPRIMRLRCVRDERCIQLQELFRAHLRDLLVAVLLQEVSHLVQQVADRHGPVDAMSEGRRHGAGGLRRAHAAALDIGRSLRVLAARNHEHLCPRLWRCAPRCRLLLQVEPLVVGGDLRRVRQVQGGAAVATVQDHPHVHTLRQWLNDVIIQLVVSDHSRALEIARDQRVVLAAAFIAVFVIYLAAMAAVMEKELVALCGALRQPTEGRQYVGFGRHHVRPVVAQATDLVVLEAEGILQDADHGVGIVNASRKLSFANRQRIIVDTDRQRLPRGRSGEPSRHGRRGPLRLRHEAIAELQKVLRGELRHLREALRLQELANALQQLMV